MRADVLKREFRKGGLLQDLLLRYTQAFLMQVAQTAACNRAHLIQGRLAKWLLLCADRADSNKLQLTHEFIAMMLCTRRPGISEAAAQLKGAGLISYTRGHITITDRVGLERLSCACYLLVKKEYTRLVGANGHASHAKSLTTDVSRSLAV